MALPSADFKTKHAHTLVAVCRVCLCKECVCARRFSFGIWRCSWLIYALKVQQQQLRANQIENNKKNIWKSAAKTKYASVCHGHAPAAGRPEALHLSGLYFARF